MKLTELAVAISKREGKKTEVNIAQISEILRCLWDLCADDRGAWCLVLRQLLKRLL